MEEHLVEVNIIIYKLTIIYNNNTLNQIEKKMCVEINKHNIKM